MKAIDLGVFVEMYKGGVWNGKIFLLFGEIKETTKKNLCKMSIAGMRAVNFYLRGDPRISTKILLYTTYYNGNIHVIEDIEWEEREDRERYFYFDLEHYLVKRNVQYELCIAPRHRLYAKSQKILEKTIYLEKKGFFYKDKNFWDFNYVPGMIMYGKTKILELVVEVFDDKFQESDTFKYCLNGCRNITSLDKEELLKKILENASVNQIQLVTEGLHIRLWRTLGIVTVDYSP